MAKMIPDIEHSLIDNVGERLVYQALREQLPRDWTVRFHYPYCRQPGGYLRDGEADFIVVAPGRGVLFLEVKASHGYDSHDGVWYRLKRDGGRERATNPFEQACRVKHEITEQIVCPRLGCSKARFPGIFAHAVVYPRARIEGRLPASQEPPVVITYRDMHRLHERLERVFSAWGHPSRASAFTPAIAERVVEIIRDNASFIAVAAADSDEVGNRIEQLTRQQFETYSGLLSNRRALISGRAGSGKTMLALWTGRFLARQDRVLFLCYNRSLALWLQRREEAVPNLEIMTFHSLCARLASRVGYKWNPSSDGGADFWAYEAPNVLADALAQLAATEKYDVVLVDEGQDFHPNWWIPVEMLLRSELESRFYIFFDPDQAIQNTSDGAYPAIATTFRLDTNCRNTRLIAGYCGRVVSHPVRSLEGAPEGVLPTVESPQPTAESRATQVRSIIRGWIEEGYQPSRIAVLSPYRSGGELSSLTSLLARGVGATPFEADPDRLEAWLDGKVLWASTIKRFKGLEADCLVVTDIPGIGSPVFSERDLYVAVSRARHHAVLIPIDEAGHRVASSFL